MAGDENAVARSQEIANGVSIDLELGKRHFPSFTVPPEKTADDYLRELCEAGLRDRYAGNEEMLPGGEFSQVVRVRLDRELRVISKLGFSNYFLICWDFVRYARELHARLRVADDAGATLVIAVLPPPRGLGHAIRDRLAKAAAPRPQDRF